MKRLLIHKIQSPLNARISIPGSKSYTARALMAATLADGVSTLTHISHSNDSTAMITALRDLGVKIVQDGSTVTVHGLGAQLPSAHTSINIGPAGTPARFLIALAAILPNSDVTISGNEQMNTRPIGPLVDALRTLGADITYAGREGCPPVRIRTGAQLSGTSVELDGSVSSQFFSALMLIAPALPSGLTITVQNTLTSASYVDMTSETIRYFGAQVESSRGESYTVTGRYTARDYAVEADATGAMNFLGLCAAAGGNITITNLPTQSLQGDMHFVEMLEAMGCKRTDEDCVGIFSDGILRGGSFDFVLMPDSGMAAAVVAAYAQSDTTLTGLGTLKVKETDRITATVEQLARLHVQADATDTSITIKPSHTQRITTPVIATYDDHRIAMAFAIAAAKTDVIIENPDVVAKSFPEFWEILQAAGIEIEEKIA